MKKKKLMPSQKKKKESYDFGLKVGPFFDF